MENQYLLKCKEERLRLIDHLQDITSARCSLAEAIEDREKAYHALKNDQEEYTRQNQEATDLLLRAQSECTQNRAIVKTLEFIKEETHKIVAQQFDEAQEIMTEMFRELCTCEDQYESYGVEIGNTTAKIEFLEMEIQRMEAEGI